MPTGYRNDGGKNGRPFRARPFPVAPLRAALHVTSDDELAIRCGVSSRTVYRLRGLGLTIDQADQWACAAGFHPFEIWGEEWYAPTADVLAS